MFQWASLLRTLHSFSRCFTSFIAVTGTALRTTSMSASRTRSSSELQPRRSKVMFQALSCIKIIIESPSHPFPYVFPTKGYATITLSETVGVDPGLGTLTYSTYDFGILAVVHTEWDAAAYSREDEQHETPDPCHPAADLPRDACSLLPAEGTDYSGRRNEGSGPRDEALVAIKPLILIKALVPIEVIVGIEWRVWIVALTAGIVSLIVVVLIVPLVSCIVSLISSTVALIGCVVPLLVSIVCWIVIVLDVGIGIIDGGAVVGRRRRVAIGKEWLVPVSLIWISHALKIQSISNYYKKWKGLLFMRCP